MTKFEGEQTLLRIYVRNTDRAGWSSTADVKRLYSSATIVSSDRIVFNVRGNAYRLVVAADFEKGIAWIRWIGTHRDYDRIDVKEVDLE